MTTRKADKNSAREDATDRIEVVNRQRSRPLDSAKWAMFAARSLRAIDGRLADREVTIVFIGDRPMCDLNRRFRGRNHTTDVLSFPAEAAEFETEECARLGDIAISVPRALLQATQNDLSFEREVAQLILHGLLHLCGYDHAQDAGEMNRFELTLRRRLRI